MASRDGGSSDYTTSRELHSFLPPDLSKSIRKGLRGRQGNGELAPETVTFCCQHQAVRMCVRLPKAWDRLTKRVLLLSTIDFKLSLFHLLSPFKTVVAHVFRLLSKTRENRNMFFVIKQNSVPGAGMSNTIPKTTTFAVKSQCGCILVLFPLA